MVQTLFFKAIKIFPLYAKLAAILLEHKITGKNYKKALLCLLAVLVVWALVALAVAFWTESILCIAFIGVLATINCLPVSFAILFIAIYLDEAFKPSFSPYIFSFKVLASFKQAANFRLEHDSYYQSLNNRKSHMVNTLPTNDIYSAFSKIRDEYLALTKELDKYWARITVDSWKETADLLSNSAAMTL